MACPVTEFAGNAIKVIAPAVKMPDGVVAVAATSSWTAFERHNEAKRPRLLAWFKDSGQLNLEELAV